MARGNGSRQRYVHKSMDNLKAGHKGHRDNKDQKESRKRLALRQHFSNYYNEVFDEFQVKKVRQMGAMFDNQ